MTEAYSRSCEINTLLKSLPHLITSSVALCSYNGARFIKEQLASILDQTCPPDEIVIYDDRSSDSTVSIVERIAMDSAVPIRIAVNEERKGSTDNFLAAIDACRCDIIYLSDQDDVWRADKIEVMTRRFASDATLGLIVSDAEAVDEDLRPLGFTVLDSLPMTTAERKKVGQGLGSHLVLKRPFGTGSSMAFRNDLKPAILGLERPARLIHDSWILTVAAAFADIAIMDETLNLYRQHAGQQVGAPPKWRASSRNGASTRAPHDRSSHCHQLETYRVLRRSLVASAPFATRSEFRQKLGEAIAHAERRLSLPRQPIARGLVVLRELLAGRYMRCSSGLKSAGKDMLRP